MGKRSSFSQASVAIATALERRDDRNGPTNPPEIEISLGGVSLLLHILRYSLAPDWSGGGSHRTLAQTGDPIAELRH